MKLLLDRHTARERLNQAMEHHDTPAMLSLLADASHTMHVLSSRLDRRMSEFRLTPGANNYQELTELMVAYQDAYHRLRQIEAQARNAEWLAGE